MHMVRGNYIRHLWGNIFVKFENNIHVLDRRIRAVCPISGVSSNRVISFMPEATQAQKDAAQAIADGWDFKVQTPEEIAAKAASEALIAAKAEAKADNIVQYLRDHTPAKCEQYVQNNVTDLASAKAFLKKVAMVLSVLAKESLR